VINARTVADDAGVMPDSTPRSMAAAAEFGLLSPNEVAGLHTPEQSVRDATAAFQNEWQSYAGSHPDPAALEQSIHDYVQSHNYQPMMNTLGASLSSQDLNLGERSNTLQQVLWSTSVQSGAAGGARVVTNAIERARDMGLDPSNDADLIRSINLVRSEQSINVGAPRFDIGNPNSESNRAIQMLNNEVNTQYGDGSARPSWATNNWIDASD
jgi:hypothetical protein